MPHKLVSKSTDSQQQNHEAVDTEASTQYHNTKTSAARPEQPEESAHGKPKVQMFVGIFTAASGDPQYAARRIAIRDTWLKQLDALDNVAHAFVIGRPTNDHQEKAMQQEEADIGVPFMRVNSEVRAFLVGLAFTG